MKVLNSDNPLMYAYNDPTCVDTSQVTHLDNQLLGSTVNGYFKIIFYLLNYDGDQKDCNGLDIRHNSLSGSRGERGKGRKQVKGSGNCPKVREGVLIRIEGGRACSRRKGPC